MTRVIKIGGSVLESRESLTLLAQSIASDSRNCIIVHGGGPAIVRLQTAFGIEATYHEGLRITDAHSRDLVEMALCGWASGQLVRAFLAEGLDSTSLSGIDRGLLQCEKLELDQTESEATELGFVGEPKSVRAEILQDYLDKQILPVVAPISLGPDGEAYNVNGDRAAMSIATAMGATELVFVSDVSGVLDSDGSKIDSCSEEEIGRLIDAGVIKGGMLPKIRSALDALSEGIDQVRICDPEGLQDGGTIIESGLDSDDFGKISHAGTRGEERSGASSLGRGEKSALTVKDATEIVLLESKLIVPTYRRPELVFERGSGSWLEDGEGNRYLDMAAGIAVNALGHSDPAWAQLVAEQASKLCHISNLYHSRPQIELAERLVEHSFADRVFFCNSGTEANEAALKFARKWANLAAYVRAEEAGRDDAGDAPRRTNFVAFNGGFHGRTMGSLSVTANPNYRTPFGPLIEDVRFIDVHDAAAAREAISEEVAAVIIEPLQGEGGVRPVDPSFLRLLRQQCDSVGAALIFDEVQCGLGRTGSLWAYSNSGVEPDMMSLAKPLAGGLPIGALLVREEIAAAMQPGDHGSTFAGGPLVCRAAIEVFDRISDADLLAHVRDRGAQVEAGLQAIESSNVMDVRGRGLLWGVELDIPAGPVIDAARKAGLLIISAGTNVIRLCPPLTVSAEEIDHAIAILSEILRA